MGEDAHGDPQRTLLVSVMCEQIVEGPKNRWVVQNIGGSSKTGSKSLNIHATLELLAQILNIQKTRQDNIETCIL